MNLISSVSTHRMVGVLLWIFRGFALLFMLAVAFTFVIMLMSAFGKELLSPYIPEMTAYFSLAENVGEVRWLNGGQEIDFLMTAGVGRVKLEDIPSGFLAVNSLFRILSYGCILFSIILTVRILRSVKSKEFLLKENALRLRWIAILGIATFLLDKFLSIYESSYVAERVGIMGIDFTGYNGFVFANFEWILSNLFLLVIAEVFRIGAELKEEQDLTI